MFKFLFILLLIASTLYSGSVLVLDIEKPSQVHTLTMRQFGSDAGDNTAPDSDVYSPASGGMHSDQDRQRGGLGLL